jgi:cation transport ATPase
MCFDKTGTITEDFCEVQGVRMVYGHKNKEYRLGLL